MTEKLTTPQARIRAALEAIGALTLGDLIDSGLDTEFSAINQIRYSMNEALRKLEEKANAN